MNTSYAYDSYRAHDLNIAMRTSSGDVIKMDFANYQSTSFSHEQNESGSRTSMTFSSMQSFQFSIDSNGIDKQDKKEIEAFMKIAGPMIDEFLKELEDDAPKSPVTKLAHQIAGIFQPDKDRDENGKNNVKTNIVKMFDNSMKKLEDSKELDTIDTSDTSDKVDIIEKILEDMKKLLNKTLKEFDEFHKNMYA